jgi:RNA polymerase sigma factor (sigma-70 family)
LDPSEASKNKGFMFLYKSQFPHVRSFVLKNKGQESDADDVFQEALLVIYNKIKDKNFTLTATIETYLFTVAKNQWYKRFRDNREELRLDDEDSQIESIDDTDIHTILADSERAKTIAKLIDQLGPTCRNLLTFFYYEKMNMKEIADTLNFKDASIAKSKKAKCMSKLKNIVLSSALYKSILK